MTDLRDARSPMAMAAQWVSRITVVAFEMVLPGVGGFWLDGKLGTKFIGLIGFGIGFVLGMWHLLAMTSSSSAAKSDAQQDPRAEDHGS